MQIYGIDLAKEKFDVSFFDLTSKKVSNQPSHKVVKNNFKSIGRFLETLPSDAVLVAEHTGVYGDTLLKCCMDSNVKIAFVGGYVIIYVVVCQLIFCYLFGHKNFLKIIGELGIML